MTARAMRPGGGGIHNVSMIHMDLYVHFDVPATMLSGCSWHGGGAPHPARAAEFVRSRPSRRWRAIRDRIARRGAADRRRKICGGRRSGFFGRGIRWQGAAPAARVALDRVQRAEGSIAHFDVDVIDNFRATNHRVRAG